MGEGRWHIVPFAIPRIRFKIDGSKLLFGNAATRRVEPLIQATMHLESGACGGSGNEFNNHLMGDKRLAPPILGDKGKEAMLNFVPLAGAWWKMGKP